MVSASARVPLLGHLLPQKGFPLCSCVSCLCPSMCACHLHTCAHTCAQGEMHTHAPYCVLPPGTCAPTFTSTHTAPGHGGMLSLGPVWASPDPGWGRGSLLASRGCVPQRPAPCTGPLPCLVCPSTCPSGDSQEAASVCLAAAPAPRPHLPASLPPPHPRLCLPIRLVTQPRHLLKDEVPPAPRQALPHSVNSHDLDGQEQHRTLSGPTWCPPAQTPGRCTQTHARWGRQAQGRGRGEGAAARLLLQPAVLPPSWPL